MVIAAAQHAQLKSRRVIHSPGVSAGHVGFVDVFIPAVSGPGSGGGDVSGDGPAGEVNENGSGPIEPEPRVGMVCTDVHR